MARRGNREGTVYEDKRRGRWVAEIRWVDRLGKPQRTTRTCRTEAEANKARKELERAVAANLSPGDKRITVEDYWKRWRSGPLLSADRKPSTVDLYRTVMRVHVLPAIGSTRISRLSASDVETMLAGMVRTRDSRNGKKGEPVEGQTRRTAFAVLSMMLDTAVRDGVAQTNVCRDVTRPKVETVEADFLDEGQLREVLAAVDGHRVEPLVVLLATTGMRIGEALALRWRDVDLEAGVLRVTGTVYSGSTGLVRTAPKSMRSRRSLPVPAVAVELLRRWHTEQTKERLRAGTAWQADGTGWIFTTETGRPMDRRNASRQYERALRAAGSTVPARFHLLRHTAASLMLANGSVSIRTVSEVLGHGSTRITTDRYGHVHETHKAAAISVLSEAVGS